MGAVFLATHARLPGKLVAIKVLHADIADSESLARFRREAEIASRLGHANIVEVHDFNVLPDGTPYLVLEYLQGESLAQRIAAGPMPFEQVSAIVRQVGSALTAAHREEIIHRDLKPQNVFLVQVEADGHLIERAKVLDFGISKIRGSQTIKTQDTSILGTPQYMAPEQALGNHAAVDARTDVFALGTMVYEMLCGRAAFAGASVPEVVFKVVYEEPPPLHELAPHLPPAVISAVHRAMAKKADERWPDVASFVEALTGQALSTGRRPLAIAPGDGATPSVATRPQVKRTGKDALAATIGSGDHAAAAAVGTANTMMAADSVPPVAPPPPARSKAGLVVGVVAIVAIAAVAIVFLLTRDKGSPPLSTVPGTVDATPMSTVPGTVDRTRWPVIVPLIAAIAVAVWAEIRVRDERRRTDAAVETLAEQLEALSRTPDKEVYGAGHRRPDPVSTVPGTVDVTPTEPPAAPAAKPVRPATRPAKPDPRRREVPIDPRCAREPLGCLKGR
jgi:serine/threonine-protein kinase